MSGNIKERILNKEKLNQNSILEIADPFGIAVTLELTNSCAVDNSSAKKI